MSADQEINLDTSILLNYVYAKLPGDIEDDRGSVQVLDSDRIYCVIGGKADSEFDALCERRYDLYEDLVEWLDGNPTADIYEYDPTSREIPTSSNDLDHIRFDVQHGWANDPRRKQLADIRRCMQDLAAFQDTLPRDRIDKVYKQFENEDLADELIGLGLDHDVDIIVDAVEIHKQDGIEVLTAVDSDITNEDQSDAINEAIRDVEGEERVLMIMTPDNVVN